MIVLKLCVVELWNCVYIEYKLSWLLCLLVSGLLATSSHLQSRQSAEYRVVDHLFLRI